MVTVIILMIMPMILIMIHDKDCDGDGDGDGDVVYCCTMSLYYLGADHYRNPNINTEII